MKKLLLVLLLSSCATTQELCRETDPKIIATNEQQCIMKLMETNKQEINVVQDSRLSTNTVELIVFHCKSKAKYKDCK